MSSRQTRPAVRVTAARILAPSIALLGADRATRVADTSVTSGDCPVTGTAGAQRPTFERVLPRSGTFGLWWWLRAYTAGAAFAGGQEHERVYAARG